MTVFLTWIPGSHKARIGNFNGFQINVCLFDLDPWILGSLDPWIPGSLDPWIPGSLDPWIPGSHMARFANFQGL